MAILLVFLALRIFMTSDRSTLDSVYPTENAISAYAEKNDAAFVTYKLPYDMSEDGYFTAYSPVYCPDKDEFQITVRYNDSLSENYLPGSTPEDYYFELRDADGNTVAKGTVLETVERYFYDHLRIAFDGVVIDEDSELYLFLCCDEGKYPYPAERTKGIIMKHPSIEERPLKLSKSEKEALSK